MRVVQFQIHRNHVDAGLTEESEQSSALVSPDRGADLLGWHAARLGDAVDLKFGVGR